MTWIVESPLTWIAPGGVRVPGRLAIGTPRLTPDGDNAICPVSLEGLQPGVTEIHGVDTLQALTLALIYLGKRLRDSVSQGWRVLLPNEGDPEQATAILLRTFRLFRSPEPVPEHDSDPEPDPEPESDPPPG